VNDQAILPPIPSQTARDLAAQRTHRRRSSFSEAPLYRFAAHATEEETPQRHAELFYLQKQIQSQTPMVVVLEDGEHIEGCIEWYDRNSLKVRGRVKTLIFKSAIKYMYKVGDAGQ